MNYGKNVLDLSNEIFLAPTTLLPLLCHKEKNNIKNININFTIEYYIKRIFEKTETNTTIPFTVLPFAPNELLINKIVEEIVNKISNKYSDKYAGYEVLFRSLNELISNIYNHTPFNKGFANQGYVFAQEFPNPEILDITIIDDGLSIPGNFEKYSISFKNDCDAISKAINGISTTKNKEKNEIYQNGRGLYTVLKFIIEGNGGNALIVSRNACLHIKNQDKFQYYHLNDKNKFDGTLISLRIKPNQVQNIYNLLELDDGKRYILS